MEIGDTAYAGYPDAVIYGEKVAGKTKGKKPRNHLIWGDWMKVKGKDGDWLEVVGRGSRGWGHRDRVQSERILEVNFVDVGQGDGCHVVTPDDKAIVIDAGVSDNMYRFLRWRYGKFEKKLRFHAAVISHPDSDHYTGFQPLFDHDKVHFDHVLHNGIVERVAATSLEGLGKIERDPQTRRRYVVDVVTDLERLKQIVSKPSLVGGRKYPKLMKTAVDGGRVNDIRWLAASLDGESEYLPGFAPKRRRAGKKSLTIEVLGPVAEPDARGKPRLRLFDSSVGKTKNGHSVVLRLVYEGVSMLLGGDLNIPAEEHLLEHYTALPAPPRTVAEEEEMIAAGRKTFEVDVAKSCHHGSADFSDVFVRALNPLVTVISSGDDEPHAHPRPDTLGAIGKHGRGSRPLIFSTELARSTKEGVKEPNRIRREMKAHLAVRDDPSATDAEKARAKAQLEKYFEELERSVARYGMINVRTDGEKVLVAQKLEKKRGNSKKWDMHRIEPDAAGRLKYQSKH